MSKTLRGGNSPSRVTKAARQRANYSREFLESLNKSKGDPPTVLTIAEDMNAVPEEGSGSGGRVVKEDLIQAVLDAQESETSVR